MTPQTQANCICQTTTSKVMVSRLAFVGLPSPSLPWSWVYSHMLTSDKGGDCLWCFLVLWLCLVPPYAKCIVCEDMQVARCLCNFPPAPFERWARCNNNNNNNKPVWLLKLNSAWLQFQRFFPWPEGPCYSVWARVWTTRTSWPLGRTWLAGPQGR